MRIILYWRFFVLVLFAVLLGCATRAPQNYPNAHEKNLMINLNQVDKGGALTTVSMGAGINELASDCSGQLLGEVALSAGANEVGLETGKKIVVVVWVSRRGHFESSLDFKREVMIVPVQGRRYEMLVGYADRMFDVRLYEVSKSGKKELPLIPSSACRPSTK